MATITVEITEQALELLEHLVQAVKHASSKGLPPPKGLGTMDSSEKIAAKLLEQSLKEIATLIVQDGIEHYGGTFRSLN